MRPDIPFDDINPNSIWDLVGLPTPQEKQTQAIFISVDGTNLCIQNAYVWESREEYLNQGSRLANIISYNACLWLSTVNFLVTRFERFFIIFLKILLPLRLQKLWT